MTAAVITTFFFESQSGCKVIYQTLVYDNGSLSCDCPGWRFKRATGRTCKHVRLIEAGLADSQCLKRTDHRNPVVPMVQRGANMFVEAGRKLDLT